MSDTNVIQNEAAVIREFANHPGMKLVLEKLNGQVSASKVAWMKAENAQKAEEIRQNARAYSTLMNILNSFLVRAQNDESKRTNTSEQA